MLKIKDINLSFDNLSWLFIYKTTIPERHFSKKENGTRQNIWWVFARDVRMLVNVKETNNKKGGVEVGSVQVLLCTRNTFSQSDNNSSGVWGIHQRCSSRWFMENITNVRREVTISWAKAGQDIPRDTLDKMLPLHTHHKTAMSLGNCFARLKPKMCPACWPMLQQWNRFQFESRQWIYWNFCFVSLKVVTEIRRIVQSRKRRTFQKRGTLFDYLICLNLFPNTAMFLLFLIV